MSAQIINLWINRNVAHNPNNRVFVQPKKACFTESYVYKNVGDLIDRNCQCAGCREFFSGVQRTTREIMKDLMPLRMTGDADEDQRLGLIQELRDNSDPFNW